LPRVRSGHKLAMANQQKTYTGVSRDTFDRLRAALRARANLTLPPGNSGSLSSRGLTGSYRFDAAAKTLHIAIEKTPLLVPKAMIWQAIDSAIAEAQHE